MNLCGLIVQPVLVFPKIPPALEHNDSLFAFSRLQSILADLAMPSLFCIKPSHNDFGFYDSHHGVSSVSLLGMHPLVLPLLRFCFFFCGCVAPQPDPPFAISFV